MGLAVAIAMMAAPRTEQAARRMAGGGMKHAWTATQLDGSPAFYVYNRGTNGGFVIISAEDRTRTVLAYADRGHFDATNMPENLRTWLNIYSRDIARAAALPARNKQSRRAVKDATLSFQPVAPLVPSRWGQDDPYNRLCPEIEGQRCPTGCVATAASQLMFTHQWPAQGKGSHSYGWVRAEGDTVTLSVDFSQQTYDWSLMDAVYDSLSEPDHQAEVAKLMYHCGVACDMGYGVGGSGAPSVVMLMKLIENFSYDKGIRVLMKDYMGEAAFLDSVNADLQHGNPVFFSARTVNDEGHAFLCDGIDSVGMVHINWGWYGGCDGYFRISVLDPEDQGTGGSTGNYAFTENVQAYSHIRPQAGDTPSFTLRADTILFSDMSIARTDEVSYKAIYFANLTFSDWSGALGLMVYQNDTAVAMYEDSVLIDMPAYNGRDADSCTLSLLDLAEGKYEVVPSVTVADQPGVIEPIYTLGIGEFRCPMVVTEDSIFLYAPGTILDPDTIEPEQPDTTKLAWDAQTSDFIENFDKCYLREETAEVGMGWLTASNDNHAHLNLVVVLPEGTKELTPGTYPVSRTGRPRSVMAGRGLNADGTISTSYGCYSNSTGGVLTPLWFLIDGEMHVGAAGEVTVDGTNSYGREIHCVLGTWRLPIENVEADGRATGRKVLRDGVLLIERNGCTYTLFGQEVK